MAALAARRRDRRRWRRTARRLEPRRRRRARRALRRPGADRRRTGRHRRRLAPGPASRKARRWPPPPSRPGARRRRAAAGPRAGSTPTKAPKKPAKREADEGPERADHRRPGEPFAIPSLPSSSCADSRRAAGPDPDLPARRRRLRARPAGPGDARRDQRDRDRLRHQPQRLLGRRGRLDAVHARETWASYGVDANGDGVADPYNPEDAIFAAASYLSAAGMPADTYGAIFAYNHADWYVAEVLANAACYAAQSAAPARRLRADAAAAGAQLQPGRRPGAKRIPRRLPARLRGRRRPLRTRQARRLGAGRGRPPGVELRPRDEQEAAARARPARPRRRASGATTRSTATRTARIRHADPADSAATLARLIWSRGSLRAGIFTHNQAALVRARRSSPRPNRSKASARSSTVDWARRPARSDRRRADQLGQPDPLQRPRAARPRRAARSTRGSSA